MDDKQSELTGRGYPISQRDWPKSGARRNWLGFCKDVHEENSMLSLRQMEKGARLSASRIGELLRGDLPVNERQARDLLSALGATDSEIYKGIRLYNKAARAELDGSTRDAAPPAWWRRSGYIGQVGDIAPLQLLGREGELEELAAWCTSGDEAYAWWQAGRGQASPR